MSKWKADISIDDFSILINMNTDNKENVEDFIYEKIAKILDSISDEPDFEVHFDVNNIEEMKCEFCDAFCTGTRNPNTGWCMDEELEVDKDGYCCSYH